MATKRKELVRAVESARRSHEASQVIGHIVPLADSAERLVRAQFALAEHDEPGKGVDLLIDWIDKFTAQIDGEMLDGFTQGANPDNDFPTSGDRWRGQRFRRMCEDLFRDAGVEWKGPAEAGQEALL